MISQDVIRSGYILFAICTNSFNLFIVHKKGITYAGKDATTKGPSATDAEAKVATKDKEEATVKPKVATNATGDPAADEGDW